MANPVFTISREDLAHFQCGACEKWWSIGDAPVRDHWFCPWCGVRNTAAADSTDLPDCDEDGVLYWDVPKGVLPEWANYIAMDGADGVWHAYQQKPVPNLPHRIFLNSVDGRTTRIFSYSAKIVYYIPAVYADQWQDSLRRVRFGDQRLAARRSA